IAALFEAAPILEGGDRMRQGQLGIVEGPCCCQSDQAAVMGHLQEPGKLHERLALDHDHMLCWHTLQCLDWRLSLRWCRCRRCIHLAVARFRLDQLLCSPGNGCTEAMLTKVMRRLLIVAAVTVPVDDVVGRGAV